ncbi:MAG: ion transporter [Acidobacteriota bacterium]
MSYVGLIEITRVRSSEGRVAPAHRSQQRRQRLRAFLLFKEAVMLTLVVLSFTFLALEHFEHLSEAQLRAVEVYEIAIALVFLAEFWFEWHFSKDRKKYFRHHWFYLIAAIPVPTSLFEILRGVRLLRLLKLLKIFAVYRYEHNTRLV